MVGQALYLETFLRVSVLSKFPKKWVPGVIFREEFENHGVMLPKSKHPILVGILSSSNILFQLIFVRFQLSKKRGDRDRPTDRRTDIETL